MQTYLPVEKSIPTHVASDSDDDDEAKKKSDGKSKMEMINFENMTTCIIIIKLVVLFLE